MADNLQTIKSRYGIIGNDPALNRALEKALQVAPTDITVLIIGESGVGKEFIPKIIHGNSARKHNPYIAVNCGAIPEGTIDSELFGHEKGAFTGATSTRKGYFEVADKGTIFLDEVGELPLTTQVRLLRVLETGEFIKVGSSQVQKTDVRIVAATNMNMMEAIQEGKFREDLYYRLNTVEIKIPPLRERKGDIYLLYRKFASDFAEKYRMPVVELNPEAEQYLINYYWPGNVRQLRNFSEEITVTSSSRTADLALMKELLPVSESRALVRLDSPAPSGDFANERELLYQFLFDMKKDLNDLKSLTYELMQNRNSETISDREKTLIQKVYSDEPSYESYLELNQKPSITSYPETDTVTEEAHSIEEEEIETKSESLSLQENEKELIEKALDKHKGKRKKAAEDLGISERTLYRKINQYNLDV